MQVLRGANTRPVNVDRDKHEEQRAKTNYNHVYVEIFWVNIICRSSRAFSALPQRDPCTALRVGRPPRRNMLKVARQGHGASLTLRNVGSQRRKAPLLSRRGVAATREATRIAADATAREPFIDRSLYHSKQFFHHSGQRNLTP